MDSLIGNVIGAGMAYSITKDILKPRQKKRTCKKKKR